jgi:hypothetical protein
MVCTVLSVSAEQMESLRAAPLLVPDVTNVATFDPPGDEPLDEIDRQIAAEVAERRSRLAGLGAIERGLDLDKAWHLLHYAISGQAFPTGADADALLLGEELGPDLGGYGPARLHDARATKKFAELLASLDEETVKKRLRLEDMMSEPIYGLPMGEGPGSEAEAEMQDYVLYHFPRLRDYVIEAALKANGLLIWIS